MVDALRVGSDTVLWPSASALPFQVQLRLSGKLLRLSAHDALLSCPLQPLYLIFREVSLIFVT
jgi:hypothetical protein